MSVGVVFVNICYLITTAFFLSFLALLDGLGGGFWGARALPIFFRGCQIFCGNKIGRSVPIPTLLAFRFPRVLTT